jgi:hypothetical protein
MATNPATVDDYIKRLESPMREIAEELRHIVREAAPQAKEAIKWGMPVYERNGNFCAIDGSRRSYVNLQLFQGASLPDPEGLLEGTGKGMRHVKVRELEGIPKDALKRLVREAARLREGLGIRD